MLNAHNFGLRLENLFVDLFIRLERDPTFYKKKTVLNADNFARLPIDTTLILLSWLIVEGGLDSDTIWTINEFKRKWGRIEDRIVIDVQVASPSSIGEELMEAFIIEVKDLINSILLKS